MHVPVLSVTRVKSQGLQAVNTFWLLTLLALLTTPALARNSTTEKENLQVHLVNAHTQQALPGQRVTAYRVSSNRLRWVQNRITNAQGIAEFALSGFSEGTVYRLKTRGPSNGRVFSAEISSPGTVSFEVGKLKIKVLNGATGLPLAQTTVVLKEKKPSGKLKRAGRASTNEAGVVYFDPLRLDSGASYVAMARSTNKGRWKYSDPIVGKGSYEFAVGGASLKVTLVDQLSGNPMPSQHIDVYKQLPGGKKKWLAKQTTDDAGQVHFDLEGVGEDGKFFLRARPFNNMDAFSGLIPSSGDVTFPVGSLQLKVISSADKQPFADGRVALNMVMSNGKTTHAGEGNTGDNGQIRFSPAQFGEGVTYIAKAKSKTDKRWKQSQSFDKPGNYTFVIGSEPLAVILKDAHSGQILPNVLINAMEQLPNGRLKWRGRATTNGQGVAQFDLDGLGEGKNFVLRARIYNGVTAFSEVVTKPGTFDFKVGKIEIQAVNGADEKPMADIKVVLRESRPGGRPKWVQQGHTDQHGIVRFDPLHFSPEKIYIVQAKSPVDNRRQESEPFSGPLKMKFVVGNKPLHVSLVNALTNDPVANSKVTAYERLEDGRKKWRGSQVTGENGETDFDLPGLGKGRIYFLRAVPYNGGSVHSRDITEPGEFAFKVGNVPVTLINGGTEKPIAEQKVFVYRKLPDGKVHWVGRGLSDASGTVYFTLPFDETQQYVFKVHNPFGNGKKFYSEPVTVEGPFQFVIDPEVDKDPELEILAPQDGAQVAQDGLRVYGLAKDDKGIDSVTVQLTSPANGATTLPADYNEDTQTWTVDIPEILVSPGETVSIRVTAVDTGKNETSLTIQVQIIQDLDAPEILFTSHSSGDSVSESGFVLAGTVTDQSGVQSLQITVDDPLLGRTLDQPLSVNPQTGGWSVLIGPGQISTGQTVTVSLAATDSVGNTGTATVLLSVTPVDVAARHLINRITFGATPDLIQELNNIGAAAYLQQQLNPEDIDDAAFEAMLGGPDPIQDKGLEQYILLHMIHSKRQLREVMTWFWDNHFNTDLRTERGDFTNTVPFELAENRAFRQNALGNFRDLLGVSAKSPSMLIFLDSVGNVKADANENYGRELLELHTMSVDGGYTHFDLEAGAEIFTGWTVQDGAFFFNAAEHNAAPQTFLGVVIPAGGVEQGEQLLDIVSTHPSTAGFICEKLSQVFISDTLQPGLINGCAAVFLATSDDVDQMAQVVSFLLATPEFSANHRTKIKTPIEFVVGVVRNMEAQTQAMDLAEPIRAMGMRLFRNPVPTGWSETGDDWISTVLLLERFRWVSAFASSHAAGEGHTGVADIVSYFRSKGLETAPAIVAYLVDITMESDFTDQERRLAEDILNANQAFDINDPEDAPYKLRQLLGTVLSYPSYQFQ